MPPIFAVPRTITVHLGAPDDTTAENTTVSFPDYIKNVASSEIYPTWPDNAIRANIYAQITFALNRIFTEYYRSRGYDFDITNDTSRDQSFVFGRDLFENIIQIVDDIFNSYIVRGDNLNPIFARYCDGTTSTCPGGLSQWGTVTLANQGLGPYEILTEYYGDDINLITDAPISDLTESYPGTPLRLGDSGENVAKIQLWLNRVSRNYPAIPKIAYPDSVFGINTEDAVKEFQEIFNLTPDGIVGRATWYKLFSIFTSVKRLSDLDSEGISLAAVSRQFRTQLSQGDTGEEVRLVQYFLNLIGEFNNFIPTVAIDGDFGTATTESVRAFQRSQSLPETGVVDRTTWDALYSRYTSLVAGLPEDFRQNGAQVYPGTPLRRGSTGEAVRDLQTYLQKLAQTNPSIPTVMVTGTFGPETERAVLAFQRDAGLPPRGIVGLTTWQELVTRYQDRILGEDRSPGQYPGYPLSEEGTQP